MAVIGINYREGSKSKNLGYKSVFVRYNNLKKKKIFKSGNFVKDWYDMIKFCITKLSDSDEYFSNSSSVDHFFMDEANKLYDCCYLDATGDKPKLVYTDDLDENLNFYVKKGTRPTWEELKKLCGDTIKQSKKNKKK